MAKGSTTGFLLKTSFLVVVVALGLHFLYHVADERKKEVAFPGQRGTLDDERANILDNYDKYYEGADKWGSNDPGHDEHNNKLAVERYFTLITDFFEYGWGDAFHMAPMKDGLTFKVGMDYWEQQFAHTVGIKKGMKVADLGMGIGGPMRRLVEFTGADITGVTICKHQIKRANQITSKLTPWMQERLHYLEGDYNNVPKEMERGTFDRVYFMESLSHAEDRTPPLNQAFQLLKPGGIVGAWQWMLRPEFDYNNTEHMELKRGMEYGGGLRNLNKPDERIVEFKNAGLEVLESYDMGTEAVKRGWKGWWLSVTEGHDLMSTLTSSYYGRHLTMATVWTLETIGIAEKGTFKTSLMLEHCGFSAGAAGELGIFTPLWVTIGRKPLK